MISQSYIISVIDMAITAEYKNQSLKKGKSLNVFTNRIINEVLERKGKSFE